METKVEKKPIADNRVIQEMITTEETYNKALSLLSDALKEKKLIGTNPLLIQLTSLVPSLKSASDKLLANVKKAVHESINDTERHILEQQRTQLLKEFLNTYKGYVKFYYAFIQENNVNPDSFKKIEGYLHEKSPSKLGLADHLIMPVQRGPRYSMLVSAATKNDEHLDDVNKIELKEKATLINDELLAANSSMVPAASEDSYYVGKWTLSGIDKLSRAVKSLLNTDTEKDSEGYKLGDVSRYLFATFQPKTPIAQDQEVSLDDVDKLVAEFGKL